MEKETPEIIDWTFEEAKQEADNRHEKLMAVNEAAIIIHIDKFGRKPESGIPLFDQFIDVGCPCYQCFRDEFLS